MKKLLLLFAAVITLFTVSCEDTNPSSTSKLENTSWKYSDRILVEGIMADATLVLYLKTNEEFTMTGGVKFDSGTGKENTYEAMDGLWSYEAPYLYLNNEYVDILTCEVKGNKIYIYSDDLIGDETTEFVLEKQ